MQSDYLSVLLRKYSSDTQGADPMGSLVRKYREYRGTTLVDCAASAAGLTADQILSSPVDPLIRRAIQDTNPTFDADTYYSQEQLTGIVNSAKGKYFEYLVADRLNQGTAVGDVTLPHGFTAKVADSMNQPGWDLQIVGPDGAVNGYLQLKATDSIGYIHHALERYPDIKILTTSEVASGVADTHMVLNSAISEDQLLTAIQGGVGDAGGFIEHFWDAFHPIIPLLLIASMSSHKVLVGRNSVQDAVEIALARSHRALVATGTGALVKAVGGGWLAIPAALIAGYWVTRAQNIDQLIGALAMRNHKLGLLAQHYDAQGEAGPWVGLLT